MSRRTLGDQLRDLLADDPLADTEAAIARGYTDALRSRLEASADANRRAYLDAAERHRAAARGTDWRDFLSDYRREEYECDPYELAAAEAEAER